MLTTIIRDRAVSFDHQPAYAIDRIEQAEKQPLHIPFAIELYDNEQVIPCRRAVTRYTR